MKAAKLTSSHPYYQAMLARDPRFDGQFFTAVRTTGIYCRPICPAKPKQKNVEFFNTALAAEKAGYRPCLRCRPECAPLSPAWIGTASLVSRALKLISMQKLSELNEDEFADLLGVSARHLRRLFMEELGRTPKQIADTHRLNFARKLLSETSLPMTEIAYSSGFKSIRNFNQMMQSRFRRTPSEIRRLQRSSPHKGREGSSTGKQANEPGPEGPGERMSGRGFGPRPSSAGVPPRPEGRGFPLLDDDPCGISLTLAYRPPLDWKWALSFFKMHAICGLESIVDDVYERLFQIDQTVGVLRLEPCPNKSELNLRVFTDDTRCLIQIVQKIREQFDLDSDPELIATSFQKSKLLSDLISKNPGLRIVRGWDPFETCIWTILGQLVSTEQASNLVRQLVENYGKKAEHPLSRQSIFLFPEPQVIAQSALTELRTTQNRKNTLREFSRQVFEKKICLEPTQNPEAFKQKLLQIKGIGPWTAEYICLRALGNADAFPHTDLILKRATELHSDLNLEAHRPWRGYAAIHLWKEYAQSLSKKKGSLHEPGPEGPGERMSGRGFGPRPSSAGAPPRPEGRGFPLLDEIKKNALKK